MASNFTSLDRWRDYFRSANSDIFDIIEHAILVAASDCPYDFRLKRDRIAELLFSCKSTKCVGCDKIELAVPNGEDLGRSELKCKSAIEAGGSKDTKESKVNSCSRDDGDDDHREVRVMNANRVSNYSYGDAEALTDEIEEAYQIHEEVLRIKEIIDNSREESDSLLFDSLRRLQLMALSVETLKDTEIGKSVNALRKHGSKEIRNLARELIGDWKAMVDSWASMAAAITVATESEKTSTIEEEEGLPSPPMDEGAFFTTPTSMELSQFFDGMDDDGNPQSNVDYNENRRSSRKPIQERKGITIVAAHTLPKDTKVEHRRNPETMMKKQAPISKPNRPVGVESGPGRPKPPSNDCGPGRPKPAFKPRITSDINIQNDPEKVKIQKPMPSTQEKFTGEDATSVGMKLEAAKRKLQERYQEAENAKKQRTIQVVELHDLPKQSLVHRKQQTKPGVQKRQQWANTRR